MLLKEWLWPHELLMDMYGYPKTVVTGTWWHDEEVCLLASIRSSFLLHLHWYPLGLVVHEVAPLWELFYFLIHTITQFLRPPARCVVVVAWFKLRCSGCNSASSFERYLSWLWTTNLLLPQPTNASWNLLKVGWTWRSLQLMALSLERSVECLWTTAIHCTQLLTLLKASLIQNNAPLSSPGTLAPKSIHLLILQACSSASKTTLQGIQ